MHTVLTFPNGAAGIGLSIGAKALLFHDPHSLQLLDRIERIGRSDATALICGETGTGKELVARHIHTVSGRSGPFVAINCGALNEALIDAELFGHEVGAFTGAVQARPGWFEAANGGTLFLDEIGDLPRQLQVKLLRVLQERQVVRLGSRKAIALDVRLVAATNLDLHEQVAADRFRTDLYYRLSVATLTLPPLRQRPGDILPLARKFLRSHGERMGLEVVLTADAKTALLAYKWPGNIRELENVIHYALIVCDGGQLCAQDLKLVGTLQRRDPLAPAPVPGDARSQLAALFGEMIAAGHENLFDSIEELLVRTAYASTCANQVQSARTLGVSRNILRTLLKRFGLIAHATGPAAVPARYATAR